MVAEHGGVDVLVNNVGAVRPRVDGFLATTDADWEWTFAVNFTSAVRATRAALPHLLASGGRIVSVSSVNARLPDPLVIDYSAAKAALSSFSKSQHPDKVRTLFLLAPIFPPHGRASRPGTRFYAPGALPVSTPPQQYGFPMNITMKAEFVHSWDVEVRCPDQREDGMTDIVWSAIMDSDDLGRTWGPVDPDGPEGVSRVRNSYWWGWNNSTVPLDGTLGALVPVCLVYGEFDTQAIHPSPVVPATAFSVPALYAAIPGTDKLMIEVACTGHMMPWENRAKDLHQMSRDWLKHTAVAGFKSGSYTLDTAGDFHPAP